MPERTLLIVEDDEMTAAMLETIGSSAGYQTFCADNGVSALELFQSNSPDVILLDINLPELNGFSFASLIRQFSTYQPRIIVVTSTPADYEEHLKELTDGCLLKPIKRQELLNILQQA